MTTRKMSCYVLSRISPWAVGLFSRSIAMWKRQKSTKSSTLTSPTGASRMLNFQPAKLEYLNVWGDEYPYSERCSLDRFSTCQLDRPATAPARRLKETRGDGLISHNLKPRTQ